MKTGDMVNIWADRG